MNWYKIFYWVTVADGVKLFFNVFAVIFTVFFAISIVGYIYCSSEKAGSSYDSDVKTYTVWTAMWKRAFGFCLITMLLCWAGFVFTPTKKDAVMIIAGGAVGNFITSDSSAKQIPAELTLLVREKMRSEIQDLQSDLSVDTLTSKSKEELIELLKKK